MALYQYSPDTVSISWNNITLNAYADGTFIEIEFSEAQWTEQVGSLGDVTRTKNLNRTAKAKVHLKAQAPVNDLLIAAALADYATGTGFGPFAMDESISHTRAHGAYAWVEKIPKIDRAKESGSVEWEFKISNLELLPGGNLIFSL